MIMKYIMIYFSLLFFFIITTHTFTLPLRFTLITSLYNELDSARRQEYMTCLEKNLAHPSISSIHILYDTSRDDNKNILLSLLKKNNVTIHYINKRPSFHDCFAFANSRQQSGSATIIANADIYFNDTLKYINETHLNRTVLALTRWNVLLNGSLSLERRHDGSNNESSQDVWIFKAPIVNITCQNIFLGTYQCDGRIAYEIQRGGYKIINPCLTVQICHLHLSDIRHYDNIPQTTGRIIVPWVTL